MNKTTRLIQGSLLLVGSLFLSVNAHGAAAQTRVNNQTKTTQVQQPASKPAVKIGAISQSHNQNNQSQQPVNNNQTNYRRMTHYQRTNYYSRAANYRSHCRGYAIYAGGPYDTNANSLKPIGYQRQIKNRVIHVLHTAKVNHSLWINFRSKISGWMNYDGMNRSTRWFYVPLISQRPQLPTGCEVTATTMMLKHVVGNRVNKMKLAREMPRSSNPNRGFVGSPYSASGWYIYPNGLRGIVNRYTHHHAWNMTGDSATTIKRQINKNRPVVIWMADIDGFPNHALTVYGYDKGHLFLNDPWRDKRIKKTLAYIYAHRSWDAMRALSYY